MFQIKICWNISSIWALTNQLLRLFVRSTIDTARNRLLSSFFYILSFLVKAISIDQTFYSATHYLAAVWLDSRHDLNNSSLHRLSHSTSVSLNYLKRRKQWLNSKLIASSRVLEFKSSTRLKKCWVELKFFWKSVKLNWEVELKNLSWIEKLDSTTWFNNSTWFDKILDKCK